MEKEPDSSRQQNGWVGAALQGEFSDPLDHRLRYSVSLTESALTVQMISAQPARSKAVFLLADCVGSHAYTERDGDGTGALADQGRDGGDGYGGDTAAYFAVYFYPFRGRWMSPGSMRRKVEQVFRVVLATDPAANLHEAQRWARAIRDAAAKQIPRRNGVVYAEVPRPCRLMVLLNPQSGRGQAMQLFTAHVQNMLSEAGVPYTLVITDRRNHAREVVRKADLSQWDALVIMSGDGLLFEVINGLMERDDWREAVRTPLGILPGGSGNALAASVHHYSQAPPAWGEELLLSCGFLLCKGLVSPLDLVSVQLPSRRLFSFLSLAWGFVADVDLDSERYRAVGAVRFLLGTLLRLASLRVYRGRLAFLPLEVEPEAPPTPRTARRWARVRPAPPDAEHAQERPSFCLNPASALRCGSTPSATPSASASPSLSPNNNRSERCRGRCHSNSNTVTAETGQTDNRTRTRPETRTDLQSDPQPDSQPDPQFDPHDVTLTNQKTNTQTDNQTNQQTDHHNHNHTPNPAPSPAPGGPLPDPLLPPLDQPLPGSWRRVEQQDFVLVLAMFQSHLSEELWAAPGAAPDDSLIHLFYVGAGVSRAALLRLFLAMERGAHLECGCPHLVYERVRALRLEPLSPQGTITVDGEPVGPGPLQAQVHPGLARLVCG